MFLHFRCIVIYVLNIFFFKDAAERDVILWPLHVQNSVTTVFLFFASLYFIICLFNINYDIELRDKVINHAIILIVQIQ